ncbi:MAG: hypothetical protein AABW87_01095 [Nanoarchaeota archaeon]
MIKKRGQAALEFLMTYGWAILIVLIAIGALAYFGVLNPERLLPRSCTLAAGLHCADFMIRDTGTGTVIILNGGAKAMQNWALELQHTSNGTCTGVGWSGTDWPAGDKLSCAFTGLTTGIKGDPYSEDIVLYFNEKGSTISHKTPGQILTRYE